MSKSFSEGSLINYLFGFASTLDLTSEGRGALKEMEHPRNFANQRILLWEGLVRDLAERCAHRTCASRCACCIHAVLLRIRSIRRVKNPQSKHR